MIPNTYNDAAFTMSYSYDSADKEYVFSCRGRPFVALVSTNLPTPSSSLLDRVYRAYHRGKSDSSLSKDKDAPECPAPQGVKNSITGLPTSSPSANDSVVGSSPSASSPAW